MIRCRMFRVFQNCVAKALYDNIAESLDELPFRKGDLLTVLEQNTAGLEGWWLCSLRGRQVSASNYLCGYFQWLRTRRILTVASRPRESARVIVYAFWLVYTIRAKGSAMSSRPTNSGVAGNLLRTR